MSAQTTLMTAVKATERGAFEYLPKPFDLRELVAWSSARWRARQRVAGATADEAEEQLPLIGRSPAMQEIYRTIARLTGTDLTVMITGESGTGKELVARALHDYGKRRAGPFVAINMAAIPRELIESELFGHERGAFTGATTRSRAASSRPTAARCSSTRSATCRPRRRRACCACCRRASSPRSAAARRSGRCPHHRRHAPRPAQLIRQGLFREDLFYRLNVVPIRLPPLRERSRGHSGAGAPFPALAAREGLPVKTLDEAAMERLSRYRWPGNVRELENLMRRLAALCPQEVIGPDVIEVELAEAPRPAMLAERRHGRRGARGGGGTPHQRLFRGAQGTHAGRRPL